MDPNLVPDAMNDLYADITPIATGGLAKVYRATRRQDGATVAVKVPLHADEATGASFMKEMLLWRNLSHPNIVGVTGVRIFPYPSVEMEYVGRSLADIQKPADLGTAVHIIRGIAEGLRFAHAKGIIHRDIKPENILLTPEGDPKISDWGMSRDISATNMPTVAGFSLSYAAPEQLAPSQYQGTDQRTDIFQLGVVFYELATGRLPFPGEGIAEVSSAILSKDPVRPSAIVPASLVLEPVICRCLRKDPAERYQSVDEILSALSTLQLSR
jgi:serine/threonine protein kinase